MKQNIVFVFLTAIILALGFYAMDIAELFGFGKDEKKLITAEKTFSKQIYLSNTNTKIAPMELIQGETSPADDRSAIAASAIVKAMAKNSSLSSISWGTNSELLSSWQVSENGYIFINGWEYVSERKNKRKLDCIIDSESLTIVYIRFYDDYSDQPTSADVNRGLEQLAEDSEVFYSSLGSIRLKLEEELENLRSGNIPDGYLVKNIIINGIMEYQRIYAYDTDTLNTMCNNQYESIKIIIENLYNSKLASFMIAPTLFSNTNIYDDNTETEIGGVTPILNKIQECPDLESPEYTAYGSCIYQTVTMNDEQFTVIYNVLSNTVEGYFFNGSLNSTIESEIEIHNWT